MAGWLASLASFVLWDRRRALEILDLTRETPIDKRAARTAAIDAVVLHQTGFSRGNDPRRYLRVTAHFVVLPDGTVAQLHPLSARLSASDGFNGRSVAIEFVGNFRSADGRWWRPEEFGVDQPTPAQLEAGRKLLRKLKPLGVRFVFAHRQAAASRGNDPGPQVWSAVGEWARTKLDMSSGPDGFAIGSGFPIPQQWRSAA